MRFYIDKLSEASFTKFRDEKPKHKNALKFLEEVAVQETYVTSFSRDSEVASQWADYADRGCGYVIGFGKKALNQHFGKTGKMMSEPLGLTIAYGDHLREVRYCEEHVNEEVEELLSLNEWRKSVERNNMTGQQLFNLTRDALTHKHQALRMKKKLV
jgi:hypothetical protein